MNHHCQRIHSPILISVLAQINPHMCYFLSTVDLFLDKNLFPFYSGFEYFFPSKIILGKRIILVQFASLVIFDLCPRKFETEKVHHSSK